jgi:hypothetical protein
MLTHIVASTGILAHGPPRFGKEAPPEESWVKSLSKVTLVSG